MKRYVIGLLITAGSSAAAFIFVLLFLNPQTSGTIGVTLLLVSLYFFIVSITTVLGFIVRVWRSGNEVVYAHLGTSFRQGLLLGLVLVGALVLQLFRIFNIWSGLLFVTAVILIELAFQSQTSQIGRQAGAQPTKKNRKVTDVVRKKQPEPWQTRISQNQ